MNPGDLDRRIQFQRSRLFDNGLAFAEVWEDHGFPVWASKSDISDGEKFAAREVAASITSRFRIWWSSFSSELTPKDRLVCEGRTYDIVGIKEIGRREGLEITAAARTDDG
jgi:head-tail adaptor